MNISPHGFLIAGLFGAVAATAAETSLDIGIGFGYLDDDSVRLTDSYGLDDGLHLYAGLGIERLDETDWLTVAATDLGLGNRSLRVEQGEWGNYRLRLDYRELEFRQVNDGSTIFTNPDANTLLLPPGWTPAMTSREMPDLDSALRPTAFGHERRRLQIDARRLFADWTLNAEAKRETRRGTRPLAGVIGNTGGNPRAVFLPVPIHYETRELDASAGYAQADWLLRFGYRVSLFENALVSTRWQNPFSAIPGWIPEAGFPGGFGELAQEPDNQHHQVYASGSWRPAARLHLNADVDIGSMRQDEIFLPYTTNPAIEINTPLPRQSLRGRIDITRVNLGLRHNTTPRLNLHAGFRYDDRDNRTPQDVFNYIGGDSMQQEPDESASRARINLPWSFRETRWNAGANWRAAGTLRVRSEYRHSETRRDYSDVGQTDTDTLALNLAGRITPAWHWQAGLAAERRRGSDYDGSIPYIATHTQAYLDTVPDELQFENHPLLRKFYLADRDRRSAQAGVSWNGMQNVSVNFMGRFSEDDYDESFFGLVHSRVRAGTLDVAWQAGETIALNGFISREHYDSEQYGRSFRGSFLVEDMNNPERDWWTTLNDRIDTIGVGTRGDAREKRWEWAADYAWSLGRSRIDTVTGTALLAEPLPDTTSRLQSLSAHLAYRFSDDWRVRLRWQHERANVSDWAFEGVDTDTLANVITLGETSPDYTVNWFTIEALWTLR